MPKQKGFFSDFFGFIAYFFGIGSGGSNNTNPTPVPEDSNDNEEDVMNDNVTKKALCIGINNYKGTSNDLKGCVNDAKEWSALLESKFKFETVLLLDSKATIFNVKRQWAKLIKEAKSGDVIVLTYSGHGTSVADKNNDEPDGRDEAICLYDGLLIDDTIRSIFSQKKEGVKLTFISDSCHSGTVTRAFMSALYGEEAENIYTKARYLPPEDDVEAASLNSFPVSTKSMFSPTEDDMNHILISGCLPTEYSYDARIGGKYRGAMSYYAINVLKNNPTISYANFYKQLKKKLPSQSYPQTPQLEGKAGEKESLMFS